MNSPILHRRSISKANPPENQERKAIEERRQQRREYAQKAKDEELNPSFGEDEDWDDGEFEDPLHDELDLSLLTKSETKTYHFLKSSSPEHLQKYFSQGNSELLAFEAMGISSKANDQLLSKDFKRNTGLWIEDMMQEFEDEQLKNWFNKVWHRVQEAYQGKDLL